MALEQEVKRIKSELADIGCRMMYDMSIEEVVYKIFDENLEGISDEN